MSHIETRANSTTSARIEYAEQVDKLSLGASSTGDQDSTSGRAVEAKFITPLDPVLETTDGRLPAVPIDEAHKLNILKDKADGKPSRKDFIRPRGLSRFDRVQEALCQSATSQNEPRTDDQGEGERLGSAVPSLKTHPLFPPLPLYGPATPLRQIQTLMFRITSAFLSTAFLAVIVLGSTFTSIPTLIKYCWMCLTFQNPNKYRPFYEEEVRRAAVRKEEERRWLKQSFNHERSPLLEKIMTDSTAAAQSEDYKPLDGGPDPLICDAGYYARRVGLDIEEFDVQTEDGFILSLWHVYNPSEYTPAPKTERRESSPDVFVENPGISCSYVGGQYRDGRRRYPVLLIHGLLQSAGAYCTNDDDSLAFYLCKQGYDVWLGNSRCGFRPKHTLLQYHDPRMWAWNIRQMGVMDLPALISRVLNLTGFPKLGLVAHSQGTTLTFVALAKEQRPDLGDKISVFCALAPAVYAGPLIEKMYFAFMRVISPAMFRVFFGIHAFIPLMMTMHSVLPGKLYGFMGYRVFSFLFNWTDTRWDLGLRDRLFQFAPVYVSAESMRWWLGRECFARQKCILATREEAEMDEVEDEEAEEERESHMAKKTDRGRFAWYDERVPPMAIWVAGSDDLVNGRRLLRRFERGREPYVELVKTKVIDEYEHLDVIWAMDSIEKVGKEVKEVIWQTMPQDAAKICRKPLGLDNDLLVNDEKQQQN